MIVVRHVFRSEHGRGGALAQAMKAGVPTTPAGPTTPPCWRLLTDLSGPRVMSHTGARPAAH